MRSASICEFETVYRAVGGKSPRSTLNRIKTGLIVLGSTISIGASLYIFFRRNWLYRKLLQRYVQSKLVRLNEGVRKQVQYTMRLRNTSVRDGHPHAASANYRNDANEAMRRTTECMGYRCYVVSPAAREADDPATRDWHQLTDFDQKIRHDPIKETDVLLCTDVDYYLDMAEYISNARPMLLYTFVPEHCGGVVDDGFFTIRDNQVEYHVSGGGKYNHPLWDYNHDAMWIQDPHKTEDPIQKVAQTCKRAFWHFLGCDALDVYLFHCDKFRVANNREIVALTPYAYLPYYMQMEPFGPELKRFAPTKDGFNSFKRIDKSGACKMELSANGGLAHASVDAAVFEAGKLRMGLSKYKYLSDTDRFLKASKQDLGQDETTLVFAYYNQGAEESGMVVHAPGEFSKHYNAIGPDLMDEGKLYARRISAPPISDEAVAPVESRNNEHSTIDGRIEAPQTRARNRMGKRPPKRFDGYRADFAAYVVPDAKRWRMCPKTVDEIVEAQNKPRQRLRSAREETFADFDDFKVQSFQKREMYSAPNNPRNISSVPTASGLRMASYTYAIKDLVEDEDWFMVGKTPRQIAESIQQLALECEAMYEGDFSRFDGSVTEWLQVLMDMIYLRAFHPDYHPELRKLLYQERNVPARTKLGLKYDTYSTRLSGSARTTWDNEMIDVFIAYCTAREQCYSHEESVEIIRKKYRAYGDDNLTALYHAEVGPTMERTASLLGLEIKGVTKLRGEHVTFLSRMFVDPWTSCHSLQDPRRTLGKLHCTTNTTHPTLFVARCKAEAYLVTDRYTPFIADYCHCVLRNLPHDTDPADMSLECLSWWVRDEDMRNDSWPQYMEPKAYEIVAAELGISAADLQEHIAKLANYEGDIMSIPTLMIPSSRGKIDAIIYGDQNDPIDGARHVEPEQDQANKNGKVSSPVPNSDDGSIASRPDRSQGPASVLSGGPALPRRKGAQSQKSSAPRTRGNTGPNQPHHRKRGGNEASTGQDSGIPRADGNRQQRRRRGGRQGGGNSDRKV